MRFYFCEGCGKRVTEHDVLQGAARDKKLKGVYCARCAEGVSTMDTLPLTDQEARSLLLAERKSDHSKRPVATKRSSRMETHRATDAIVRPIRTGLSAAGHKRSQFLIVLSSVGAAAIAGVFLFVMNFYERPESKANTHRRNRPKRSVSRVKADAANGAVSDPVKKRPANGQSRKKPPEGPSDRTVAGEMTAFKRALASLADHDWAQRIALAETTLKRLPAGPEADRLSRRLAEWRDKLAAQKQNADNVAEQPTNEKVEPDKPPQQKVRPVEQPPKPIIEPFKTVFEEKLNEVLAGLRSGSADKAQAAAGAMAGSDEMGAWQAAAASVEGVVAGIREASAAQREALKKHIGAKKTIQTKSGPKQGKVVAAGHDWLELSSFYYINKKQRLHPPVRLMLGECTPAARRDLLGLKPPESAQDFVVAALGALSQGEYGAAKRSLEACEGGKHALEAPLRWYLERVRAPELADSFCLFSDFPVSLSG